jgi:redox-sensitive bicupin YhaK (pirin superfamily)
MPASPILDLAPLGPQWPTLDPFLFCAHHDDAYPRANAQMGPDASLAGRSIGQDFSAKDGWSMYHGREIPGFPAHPHRGFETVTLVRTGLIDHADSLGATARFGRGDVQWLTAGRGIVHAEMFPLLDASAPNPAELFQVWLNLPARNKMAEPHFTMLWADRIPRGRFTDDQGRETLVTVVAGRLEGVAEPLPPPPASWAAQPGSDVAIWTLRMAPGARWTLPAAAPGSNRLLYFFAGVSLGLDGQVLREHRAIALRPDVPVALANGETLGECLLLQGRPIAEPVAQYGPFVMNTREEINQAMADYRRTQFGGWPYPQDGPVHGREPRRFARHPDGKLDQPA